MKKNTEARLEDAIVDSLTREGGFVLVDYRTGPTAGRYVKALALDPALVRGFVQATQPKVWQSLQAMGRGATRQAAQREPPPALPLTLKISSLR